MTLAWLNEARDAVEQYPVGLAELRRIFPRTSLPNDISSWQPGDPREANLPPRLVIVRSTARPSVERWQRIDELTPEFAGGFWQQAWQVVDLFTLEEAKTFLRQRALEVWWGKWLEEPTPAQVSAANLNPQTLMVTRAGQLQSAAQNFSSQIDAAATLARCWELFEILEGA